MSRSSTIFFWFHFYFILLHCPSLLHQYLWNCYFYSNLFKVTDNVCHKDTYVQIFTGNTKRSIAELKGHEVNMICKENCLFSPRALVKGIPTRVDFHRRIPTPHHKDKTVSSPSYIYYGNLHTWKDKSLYWDSAQFPRVDESMYCSTLAAIQPYLDLTWHLSGIADNLDQVRIPGDWGQVSLSWAGINTAR